MRFTLARRILRAAAVAAFAFFAAAPASAEPLYVYLTWRGDTSRTMTVNYQTSEEADPGPAGAPPSVVLYDTRSGGGDPKNYRKKAEGESSHFVGEAAKRRVHHVELAKLRPGKTYYFIAGDEKNGYSKERKFRTAPAGREPVRFITGGDMAAHPVTRQILEHSAKQEPLFGIIGGDIAYENGDLANYGRYDLWLKNWAEAMITPEGYTIPMVLAIGNHEVKGSYGQSAERAPFYIHYFRQEGDRSYFTRKFGKNFVFFALDSGHIAAHGGDQAKWLDAEMEKHKKVKLKYAIYHVPLYPSHRSYDGAYSVLGRKNWLPIFDKHGLTVGFENHDHTYKRSKILKHNQVSPTGTLYLGDGCFGQGPREVAAEMPWYLEKQGSIRHFWIVDVTKKGATYRAMDQDGKIFDTYPESAAPAPAPAAAGGQ